MTVQTFVYKFLFTIVFLGKRKKYHKTFHTLEMKIVRVCRIELNGTAKKLIDYSNIFNSILQASQFPIKNEIQKGLVFWKLLICDAP